MQRQQTHKNHFIPSFYSKLWATEGKLWEFSRPYDQVVARQTHPSGTGYAIDIYTEDSLPAAHQTHLEDVFLKMVDQQASEALRYILAGRFEDMGEKHSVAWVRFLMSLLQRSPGKIATLRQRWDEELASPDPEFETKYRSMKTPNDPETFQEFMKSRPASIGRGRVHAIQNTMDLPMVGTGILKMHWCKLALKRSRHEFLTSDRPVIMTNGLARKEGHIALPLGPRLLFVAVNERNTLETIASMSGDELALVCNDRVTKQAERIVIGRTDKPLRFVERNLRKHEVISL